MICCKVNCTPLYGFGIRIRGLNIPAPNLAHGFLYNNVPISVHSYCMAEFDEFDTFVTIP